MRLEEIDGSSAAEQRLKRLKGSAKAAKARAKQLKTQADRAAEVHAMRTSRQRLAQIQRDSLTSNIKPYC